MGKLTSILLSVVICAACAAAPALAAQVAYPPNVYFHFTDGHGSDFRVPQAVPGLATCDQVKLALIAKQVQAREPVYAGWTYVKAECRAPRTR